MNRQKLKQFLTEFDRNPKQTTNRRLSEPAEKRRFYSSNNMLARATPFSLGAISRAF
jgi:hypothetical protein